MLKVRAYAKVNLTLEVVSKRDDGYHNIRSVMQTVDIFDELHISKSNTLSLNSNVKSLENQNNLVLRAAEMLRKEVNQDLGAEIILEKGIPLASGLGGGSSDAAATLKALNQLWQLDLTHDRLMAMSASIGSDVPFFLSGGLAMVWGRGEQVTHLETIANGHFVFLIPDLEITNKTAWIYSHITPTLFTNGDRSRDLFSSISDDSDVNTDLLGNVFQSITPELIPSIKKYQGDLLNAGAPNALLSGTGPSVYAYIRESKAALRIKNRLEKLGHRPILAKPVK